MAEAQPQPPPNTRLAEESNTSQKKNADEAVKAIYKMISKYNGIVRKIMETIEPIKGPWSTRRSVDQSTISYYAQVLKGVLEPLKHLMFQLGKVNEPVLSSMVNMIDNMIKMIDMAPPFSMIDSSAYKQGTFDYTGLNDDMTVGSLKDYINLLRLRLNTLKNTRDQYDTSKEGYLKSLPANRREDIKQLINKTYKDADLAMEKTAEEILRAKKQLKAGIQAFEPNQAILGALELSQEELNELFDPDVDEEDMTTEENLKLYEGLASATKIFDKQDENTRKEQRAELKALKKAINKIESDYMEKYKATEFDIVALGNQLPSLAAEYSKKANRAARLAKDIEKGDPTAKEEEKVGKASGACGSGSGPYVYYEPKGTQYNTMGRPISNDEKINNDMINANRNWQINNNGPHDTPIGNLNPFLAQDNASKYTYEVMLAKQNAEIHPEVNALGANISLLQGPITNMSGSGKKSKAMDKISKVAIDEKNDMFKPMQVGDKGYIPEEKEDQFKLPDLKPKKRK
jgi:hypothetical protein